MAIETPLAATCPPAIDCTGLTCVLGSGPERVTAVNAVSLSVARGELVAIVGPSGCGKSSLLYALGLLDSVDAGMIRIDGDPVPEHDEPARARLRNRSIGFVFQFHYLLSEFTAEENVSMPRRKSAGRSESEDRQIARSLLAAVGMEEKASRPAHQLSGGERQRVALARALANDPSVLLADEPTGNLDQSNSDRVFELLRQLTVEKQMGVLMVTHNKTLAQRADRVLTMLDGRLQATDSPD